MTKNNELCRMDAHRLAAMLRAGEITSVELTQAFLDQIAALNPTLNAYLYVDADGALATAKSVDEDRAAGLEKPV